MTAVHAPQPGDTVTIPAPAGTYRVDRVVGLPEGWLCDLVDPVSGLRVLASLRVDRDDWQVTS